MDDRQITEATDMPVDEAVKYVLKVAEQKAEAAGQELGFDHLLLAVLDRHLAMAERLMPEVAWHSLRIDLYTALREGKHEFEGDVFEVLRRAGMLARSEGTGEVRLSHLVRAVTEMAAEMLSREAAATTADGAEGPKATEKTAAEGKRKESGPGVRATAAAEALRGKARRAATPFLDSIGVDLTQQAREGKLPPVVGREREINTVIEILCRQYKRNPLLIGPAGVGKTAIVEGLAQRIAAGRVPEPLQGARIIQVTPTALLRQMGLGAEDERRMEQFLREAAQPGIILFIDEVHRIVGIGGAAGLHALAQRLKPALARGEIACIGATTEEEYREYIKDDRALERRFQPLRVHELSPEATREILNTLAAEWAEARHIQIPEPVLDQVIKLSGEYMRSRRYPDKAITLLDTVLSRATLGGKAEVSEPLVRETVCKLIGALPEQELVKRLDTLEEYLNEQVFGQQEAARLVAQTLRVTMRGLDVEPERPNGVFVFAGPPSVGKRTMAKAIAAYLFDAPDRVLELEMVRYAHDHGIYELIGAPPGYVGYEEGGKLEWVNDVQSGLILLDNLQQAHPRVVALFEEIFDSGETATMRGERLYFGDIIFVITCDVRSGRRGMGFEEAGAATEDPSVAREVRKLLGDALLDRVDAICPFYGLSAEAVQRVLKERIVARLKERARTKGIVLEVDDKAVEWLAQRAYSEEHGLQRATKVVQRLAINPVLDAIGSAGAGEGEVTVELTVENGRLVAVRK